MDVLVTTKKAPFKGVVVSVGYKFMPDVLSYVERSPHNVYIVKHCENPNHPTHIVKDGVVNRYGWIITDSTLFSDEDSMKESIDIKKGWFCKKGIREIKDVDSLL